MTYLIAILTDRPQAEAANAALAAANIPAENRTLVGAGYQTPIAAGLLTNRQKAQRQIRQMAIWLVPFGFIAGILFDSITGLQTFAWTGALGNQILGGILGAGSGALGSFFVGGGTSMLNSNSTEFPYEDSINAGRYLLVISGAEAILVQAARTLLPLKPDALQRY